MRAADGVEERAVQPGAPAAEPAGAGAPDRRPGRLAEAGVHLSYLVLALLVTSRLWADPNRRVLSGNRDDHGIFLFMLAHAERVVFHGAHPFWSDRLNVPDGVNMMANTSILALSLPVAPVTHLLGGGVSVALLITLGLAGTAAAWYWVLSRHLVRSRRAAWIGGLWCGFCPAMISHANGHINFVSNFVLPFIVWQVLRLREPGRVLRGGVLLGLLITLQVFINEEALLFVAMTLGVFVVAYAALDRAAARAVVRHFAAGLGVAALTASVLLAFPLWWQFFQRGSYHGQPFDPGKYVTDLLSLGAFARQSLAGNTAIAKALSVSPTEDNTFFGVPMLVLLVVSVIMLRRSAAATAAGIAGLVLLVVSFGPELRVAGANTGIPLPFALIADLPVIDLVSVTRFAMVPAVVAGVLLALAADRAGGLPDRRRTLYWVGLAVALVTVFPKPLPVDEAPPMPPFIADGLWRPYVPDDRTLVTVPLPEVTFGREAQRWATLNNFAFAVPRGYFMGPVRPPEDDTGSWNAPRRPTSDLLIDVIRTGRVPAVTAEQRRAARTDLVFWRAAVVVLIPRSTNGPALQSTVTSLLGRAPQPVGGVLLWDVRDLPVPPRG